MKYVVQKGDTLYGISRQFHVAVDEIKKANQLSSNSLSIGMILTIPIDSSLYEVKKGDTLYSISKKYNISVSELLQLNNLTSSILNVGQVLKVPSSKEETSSYVVKRGDTLYGIAREFGVRVSDLILWNQLSSNTLKVGQTLIVSSPSSLDVLMGSSCYGDGYQETVYLTYKVRKGDTLYGISKKYGVTVDSLIKLNSLSSSSLSVGDILKIKEEA